MKTRRICFIISILLVATTLFAQQEETAVDRVIEQIYDFLMEDIDDEAAIDYGDLYDDLTAIYESPINLNTATPEELAKVRFLSDIQIENLMYYIYKVGRMQTIYELQLVDGFDPFTIRLLLPFVRVATQHDETTWNLRDVMRHSKHELTARFDGTFETRQGYTDATPETLAENPNARYTGDPFYTSLKYRLRSSDKLELGLTMEKDAGEQWFGNYNKKLFDSYSGFIQMNKLWKFATIVVGDYRANFGQGLVVQQDMNMGKTAMTTNVTTRTRGLKRHSSTDEYNFLRGVGATARFSGCDITAFYSFRMMDADTAEGAFASFKKDGYHRTPAEYAKQRNVAMHVLGGNVTYRHKFFRIGATVVQTWLNPPLDYEPKPYQEFYFRGNRQFAASIDYLFAWRGFNLFGETAVEGNGAIATLNGLTFAPASTINFVLMHRYYGKNYDVLFANAFGENNTRNENGFYIGTEIKPARRWKLSAYADLYNTPWVTYTMPKPTQGYATLLQADFMPNRKLSMYARLRYRYKECKLADNAGEATTHLDENRKIALRYNLVYTALGLDLKSTIEWNWIQTADEMPTQGFLIAQDAAYTFRTIDLTLSARYAYFDAKNYENRFSLYERDVPSAGFAPSMYGTGSRWYLNIDYDIVRGLKLMLRIAQTYYTDGRTQIGSGLNQIDACHKTDFRLFVQYKF